MTDLTCEYCGDTFEKTNKRGPKPKFCKDACKVASHRAGKSSTKAAVSKTEDSPRQGLTLRDVINVAELELSVKQCDVVINAFTKARLRAARRERDK